jgi:peptidyl-prolyl isomerase D
MFYTNGRVATPHLDGKHVVFGKVYSNKGLVRRIENIPTTDDRPKEPVVIASAGVLSEDDLKKLDEERGKDSGGEDIWEDYPVDEDKVDEEKPEEALRVGSALREIGTR